MRDFTRNSFSIGDLADTLLLSGEQIALLAIIAERSQDAIAAIVTDQNRRSEALQRLLENTQSVDENNTPRVLAALKSFKASRRELSAAIRAVITRINELLNQDQKTALASFAPQLTETELAGRIANLLSQNDDDKCLALKELVTFVNDPLLPRRPAQFCHRSQDLLGILMITPDFISLARKDIKEKETT